MIAVTHDRPLPLPDEHSRRYWEAAAAGELLIQRCSTCGAAQMYPRRHCTSCWSSDPAWERASGHGRLHTFTVVGRTPNPEFAGDCPYVFAIVELDEGPRIATRIVDVEAERLACDLPVVLCPPATGEPPLPRFTLAEPARSS